MCLFAHFKATVHFSYSEFICILLLMVMLLWASAFATAKKSVATKLLLGYYLFYW